MTFSEEVKMLKGLSIIEAGVDGDGTLVVGVSDAPSEQLLHAVLVSLLECVCRREMDRYMENGMDKDTAAVEARKNIGAAFIAFSQDFDELVEGEGVLS